MERLTEKIGSKYCLKHCLEENPCSETSGICLCGECSFPENAYRKLGEYEDLEEQGKLLKLPCTVGDTVYTNYSMQGWYFRKENRPYAAKIAFIGLNEADNYINIDFGDGHMIQFKFSDIGKTVFLTREEAEVALKQNEMR